MTKMFVYGTLKRGYWNNQKFMEGCEFLGEATSVASNYSMHGRHIPFLSEGGTQRVRGELWEVHDEALEAIDCLEGHPGFYTRQQKWFVKDDGKMELAWVYLVEFQSTDKFERTNDADPCFWEAPR